MRLLHVGGGASILADRIVAVVLPDSEPIRRQHRKARKEGYLIDLCRGRKIRAVLYLDTGQLAIVPLTPETVSHRLAQL